MALITSDCVITIEKSGGGGSSPGHSLPPPSPAGRDMPMRFSADASLHPFRNADWIGGCSRLTAPGLASLAGGGGRQQLNGQQLQPTHSGGGGGQPYHHQQLVGPGQGYFAQQPHQPPPPPTNSVQSYAQAGGGGPPPGSYRQQAAPPPQHQLAGQYPAGVDMRNDLHGYTRQPPPVGGGYGGSGYGTLGQTSSAQQL